MFRFSKKYESARNSRQSTSRVGGTSSDKSTCSPKPQLLSLKRLDVDDEETVVSNAGSGGDSVVQRIFRFLKKKKKTTKLGATENSSEHKPRPSKLTFNALWSALVATKETSKSLEKECRKVDITRIQGEIEDMLEQINQKHKVLECSYCAVDITDEELEDELDAMMNHSESDPVLSLRGM